MTLLPHTTGMAGQALVGERVRRLRTARGLSQEDLAQATRVASGTVSMLENGRHALEPQLMRFVADALHCTFEYLIAARDEPLSTKPWLRAYADAPKRLVDKMVADSITAVDTIERLGLRPRNDVMPIFTGDLNDEDAIESFAEEVRAAAELAPGSVVGVAARSAERLGCLVLPMEDELGRHLGLSLSINGIPVLRVAKGAEDPDRDIPGDRQRFTIAHEIGHLALHRDVPPPDTPEEAARIERQAHRFAGAYLAPADPLVDQLNLLGGRVTLRTLAEIKATWGVSIKMLVLRFRQLNVIGDDQSRSLYKQISARKWNKQEPVAVPTEHAIWLGSALKRAAPGREADAATLAASRAGVDHEQISSWFNWQPTPKTPSDSGVINLNSYRTGARSQYR